jgi:hypothetical protein
VQLNLSYVNQAFETGGLDDNIFEFSFKLWRDGHSSESASKICLNHYIRARFSKISSQLDYFGKAPNNSLFDGK